MQFINRKDAEAQRRQEHQMRLIFACWVIGLIPIEHRFSFAFFAPLRFKWFCQDDLRDREDAVAVKSKRLDSVLNYCALKRHDPGSSVAEILRKRSPAERRGAAEKAALMN
ncbi:MAG: hypothetical protein ACYC2E_15310 [Sulfuricella sp.]